MCDGLIKLETIVSSCMVYILHGYEINNNNVDHTADLNTVLFGRGYSNGKK